MNKDFDRELTEELRDHLERRKADLVRSGLTAAEAHRRARVEFGGVEAYKEQIRDSSWRAIVGNLPEQLWRELVLALRRLRATPVFTVFAIASLAVGVGVTTAFYSVMYPVLRPASGVRAQHDLAYLIVPQSSRPSSMDWAFITSWGDFEELRRTQTSFSGIAAWTRFGLPFIDGDMALSVGGEAVTGNLFDVLGAGIARGRGIQASDDQPGAPAVAVLDHAFWKSKLGGDPGIVGRSVRIGGQPVTIVGVAGASFHGVQQPYFSGGPQLWMPLTAFAERSRSHRAAIDPSKHDGEWLSVVGRLGPGRSAQQASVEVGAIAQRLDHAFPRKARYARGAIAAGAVVPRRWSAKQMDRAVADVFRENLNMGYVLLCLVGLVLAVACTNLANLTLARGSARQHEFAVRRALGSSRARLVREQFIESAVIGVVGGGAGLLVARGLLLVIAANVPAGVDFNVETDLLPGVLVATAVALAVTLLIFGLSPALQLSRAGVRTALTSDTSAAGAIRWRSRRGLVAAQVAVSAGFFLVAGMFVRSIASQGRVDSGIDLDRMAVAQLPLSLHDWEEPRVRATAERILEVVRADAGVADVAISAGLPFGYRGDQIEVAVPDRPFTSGENTWTYIVSGTPDLFRVLGVPVLKGRAFDERDTVGAPATAVLSERTAQQLFGGTEPVGRQVLLRAEVTPRRTTANGEAITEVSSVTVVGIARDTDVGSIGQTGGHRNLIYVPLAQRFSTNLLLVARTAGDVDALATGLRTIPRRADPDLVVASSGSGRAMLDQFGQTMKMMAASASALGTIVLGLAMTGLFGVLSHLVARRTREMGVRVALGATGGDIVRMVLADGFRPVLIGLVAGVALGTVGRLIFRAVVRPTMEPGDPLALVLTPIPLIVAALIACYLPARRASRVDPNVALRNL